MAKSLFKSIAKDMKKAKTAKKKEAQRVATARVTQERRDIQANRTNLINTARSLAKKAEAAAQKCNSTDSIKTFFDSWNVVESVYRDLKTLNAQSHGNLEYGDSTFQNALSRENKISDINKMLDRCWTSTQAKAVQLTTPLGKKNKLMTFFETAKLYEGQFEYENIEHVREIFLDASDSYGFDKK